MRVNLALTFRWPGVSRPVPTLAEVIAANPAISRPAVRIVALWSALVVAVLVLAELTDNVVDHDGVTRLDRPWHRWVLDHRSPGLNRLMEGVSTVGSTAVLAAVAVLVAAWLVWRRRWEQAVLVGVATGGAGLLVPLIKNLVDRPRPPMADRLMVETSWSYPSGHSLGATAVIGALTVVAATATRGVARAAAVALGLLLVAAIGVSRIYLGVHWPSDVFAGWLVGGLWLAVCRVLTSRWPGANGRPPSVTVEER